MDLHDLLVGRTLGRITPIKNNKDEVTAVFISFQGKDEYHLIPKEGTVITDLFINTAHKAQPITYLEKRKAEAPLFWCLEFGCDSHPMVQLLYLPANSLRPLALFDVKQVKG